MTEKYHILEDTGRDDFSIMLEKFEDDGWEPIWDTYKVIWMGHEKADLSKVLYHVMLKKNEDRVKNKKDFGLLGKGKK